METINILLIIMVGAVTMLLYCTLTSNWYLKQEQQFNQINNINNMVNYRYNPNKDNNFSSGYTQY